MIIVKFAELQNVNMKILLQIIVCTRNRAFILPECLDALLPQLLKGKCELLVVDNGSEDETSEVVMSRLLNYGEVLKYEYFSDIGLSKARNYGVNVSDADWIGYIDDDAKVPLGFVEQVLNFIRSEGFDCFGGTYTAWEKYGRPCWLPQDYGNKSLIREQKGEVPEGEYLSGGVFFCKASALKLLGGFREDLGMNGDVIGYGEEDEFQIRARAAGISIGYDPELYIEHCILPHKLNLRWHLGRFFAAGRVFGKIHRPSLSYSTYWFLRTLVGALFIRLPIKIILLVFQKNFCWKKIIYETMQYPLKYAGCMVSCYNRNGVRG